MKIRLILFAAIIFFAPSGFANVFPLVLKELEGKQLSGLILVEKHFKSGKGVLSRITVSKRMKSSGKQRDPFTKGKLRNAEDEELLKRKIRGANFILSLTISKKVIFRPREKDN